MSDLNQPDLIIDPSKDRLFSGVRHLLLVCQELGFSLAEIEGFSKAATSHLTKSQRIEYDMEFREHKRELQEFLMRNKEKNILEDYYLEALQTAVKGLKWEEKLRLVMDLNHMHLNRYYLVEQQRLEAKSYYLLCKVGRVVVKL